ncbi:unnamed protein product [Ceutorhynchus assimilis]|uniref:Protein lin-37 homolog n=1 Tax=Ceutorhynchus assimilis TaxID=467358 RepID=A0A9N9QI28_9CUCU|nr:unnamed protein product [Ceutorhynchus assimilis]
MSSKKELLPEITEIQVEIKEENKGNDYSTAKGRLKGALKQLTQKSSEEDSESSDGEADYRKHRSGRKKRNQKVPTPYHHTYLMKLYDRSVDLAKFEEDTPLYPLCRAWMKNQPKNQQKIIKRRASTPEPQAPELNISEDTAVNVERLPPPSTPFVTRIPSPLPEQLLQHKDNLNLDYDECAPVDKNVLIRNHLQRWAKVKKKWIETENKNSERFQRSSEILQEVYNKSPYNIKNGLIA